MSTSDPTTAAKPKPKANDKSGSDLSASSAPEVPKRFSTTTQTAAGGETETGPSTRRVEAVKDSVGQASAPLRSQVPVELSAPPAALTEGTVSDQAAQVLAPSPAAPGSAVSRWTTVLSAVGLTQTADGDGPQAPVDSPLALVGLAAFRRQTQQASTEDATLTKTVDQPQQSSLTLLSADSLQAQPMRTAARAVNSPPDARDDAYITAANTTLTVTSANTALKNDTDANGDKLRVISNTVPAQGTLTMSSTGQFTYVPKANFVGTDSFNYTVSDGKGGTDTATVTITVTAVNKPPDAINDAYTVAEDSVLTVTSTNGVLKNDVDPDADPLTVISKSAPAHGTLAMDSAGQFTYTPQANFNGTDSFNYTVSDGKGGTDTATVTITVTPVNDAPVAINDGPFTVGKNTAKTLTATDLVGNDTDVDTGDTLALASVSGATNGTAVLNADGTVTFTPSANYAGPASFMYRVKDSTGATSADATVNLTVTDGNQAPVASPTVFSTELVSGSVTGSVNATDADGNALSYTLIGAPLHGVVAINPFTGAYAYTPSAAARLAADQTAGPDTDTFTVAVGDGQTVTNTLVTVPISPANLTLSQTTTPVGAGAAGIAFRGPYAFVANPGAGTVSVIDTRTNAVISTLQIGGAPTSVATVNVGPDYQGTFGYVTNRTGNSVAVINTYDMTGVDQILVGNQPWDIVQTPNLGNSLLFVSNSGSNTVSVIDASSRTVVSTIPVGTTPMGMAMNADGTRVYVANKTSNTVSVIDTASRSVVATVQLGAGTNPTEVAVNSTGTRAYVANSNGTVSVIDTTAPNPTVIANVQVGPQPYGLAVSPDGSLYVANGNDTISVIDTGTNAVVRTVTMDSAPETGMHGLAVDPYGRVYTTDAADGVVRSFSVSPSASSALPITSTAVAVGSNPSGVAVAGTRAYVLNTGSDTVSVIDTTTKQVIKTIPIGASATNIVVTPDGQRIYVANYDTVSVIDTTTGNQIVSPIVIPDLCENGSCYGSSGGITDLAISPDGTRAYVVREYYTDTGKFSGVSLIDTNTNTVTTTAWTYPLNDIDVSGDGTRLYGAEGDYRFVNVFDAATLSGPGYIDVSTPEPGWAYATAVATSSDGRRTYAIVNTDAFSYSSQSKYVSVIDTDPASSTYNTQIGQIAVAYGAVDLALSPDSSRLYVTLADGKTVEVVDTASHSVVGYFTRPSSGSLAVGPDGTVYLTDYANGTVFAVTVGSTPSSL